MRPLAAVTFQMQKPGAWHDKQLPLPFHLDCQLDGISRHHGNKFLDWSVSEFLD